MPANIRDMQLAVGFKKQADVATASPAGDYWRVTKTNAAVADVRQATEPADEIGSGTDFATAIEKTVRDTSFSIEKTLSSQIAAWAFAMAFGKVAKSGSSSPFTYTLTPLNPAVDCLNLPTFTLLEKIPHCGGAGDVLNRAILGNVIAQLTLTLESGPSRNSARIALSCVGTGKTDDSGSITMPAALLAEARLPASSMTLAINGQVNLVSGGLINSVEFTYDNAPRTDEGYYPGSGVQDGFAVRGRMEMGPQRSANLRFVARAQAGSPELTRLKNLTEGTAVIGLTGANISGPDSHSLQLTLHRVIYSAVEFQEANGIVAVAVTATPLYHPTNGLATAVIVTNENNIGTASA